MRNKWLLVALILLVAATFRLQNIFAIPFGLDPTAITGNGPFLFRIFSAIAGILTVLGLYLLANRLFNWKIAAISSYLMAISFWHVSFSRTGLKEIAVPLFLVWGLYYFWRGLSSSKIWNFAVGGIFLGLGLYTYASFWIILVILLVTLFAYWSAVKKDFDHEKYIHTRNQVIAGLALLSVVFIIIALPMLAALYTNPINISKQNLIFGAGEPFRLLGNNIVKALGMFNFTGDNNWLHNIAGQSVLFWPVGILFALGFLRSIIKFFAIRKKHGHFPTIPTLLLSWFFAGLIPQFFYNAGVPDSLQALIVAPSVFIFAGEGLWWIIDKTGDWWRARDVHEFSIRHRWLKESSVMAIFALVVLLFSFTAVEYDKYFNKWAKDPHVIKIFNQSRLKY